MHPLSFPSGNSLNAEILRYRLSQPGVPAPFKAPKGREGSGSPLPAAGSPRGGAAASQHGPAGATPGGTRAARAGLAVCREGNMHGPHGRHVARRWGTR